MAAKQAFIKISGRGAEVPAAWRGFTVEETRYDNADEAVGAKHFDTIPTITTAGYRARGFKQNDLMRKAIMDLPADNNGRTPENERKIADIARAVMYGGRVRKAGTGTKTKDGSIRIGKAAAQKISAESENLAQLFDNPALSDSSREAMALSMPDAYKVWQARQAAKVATAAETPAPAQAPSQAPAEPKRGARSGK